MFVVTVSFAVESERLEEFMPLMRDNAAKSLALEPGCRKFDVCQDPDRLSEIFLYEIYDDAAAFEHHKTMPHYLAFSDLTAPMIRSKSVRSYALVKE